MTQCFFCAVALNEHFKQPFAQRTDKNLRTLSPDHSRGKKFASVQILVAANFPPKLSPSMKTASDKLSKYMQFLRRGRLPLVQKFKIHGRLASANH